MLLLFSNVVGLDRSKLKHAALFSIHALVSLIGYDEVRKRVVKVIPEATDSMLVDSDKLDLTLMYSLEAYNDGTLFGGQFVVEKDMSVGKFESKIKIYTHLLSQLCISDPRLLAPYFDLFAAGFASFQDAESVSSASAGAPQEFKSTSLTTAVLASIRVIIPAIGSSVAKSDVFNYIKSVDALAFPLVVCLLETCQADVHLPASSSMIENVTSFVRSRHDIFTSQVSLENDSSVRDGVAYADQSVVKFLIPVISGMDTETLSGILPYVLLAYVGNETLLNQIFHRIVQARPPSLTKSGLLVALHRIKPDVFGFDQKMLVQAIGLCLDKKDEFTGDVVQDALNVLAQDEQLPDMIMRTAIIGYQTHSELKSYVLTTLIPALMKRSSPCWDSAPKVWDGVVYVLNKLCSHKDVEATLKVLLHIPLQHLKGAMEGAPNSKPVVGSYFKSLPVDLRESSLDGSSLGVKVDMKGLQEKLKFLQSLE